jgi:gamma-glutamyltranspeptidase/glutathione hydrolase
VAWGEPLQAAIDAPRWRLEGDRTLALEAGTSPELERVLRAAGYVEPAGLGELGGRSDFGGAQVVLRTAQGQLVGGSDKRKDGLALAG